MQARRVLLLFAVVLGLAAVAASVAPPPEERRGAPPASVPPPAIPQPERESRGGEPREVTFEPSPDRVTREPLRAGEQALVTVQVAEPGQVEIPALGLLQTADPSTPAVFDLVVADGGRYPITFAAPDDRPHPVGVLLVSEP